MFKKKNKVFLENEYTMIHMNDCINLCVDACSVCWDKQVPQDMERRQNYIATRAKTGHESVFEHSNMILLVKVRKYDIDDLIEVLTCCRYLNTEVVHNGDFYYCLIGGSIRGYKEIYTNIKNMNNKVLAIITKAIYENCSYSFFENFINDGIFDKNKFIKIVDNIYTSNPVKSVDEDKIIIRNMDKLDPDKLTLLYELGFDDLKILGMCSVTILFKDMSRIITQQLTRHRNGITQESQRYVDYSNVTFNSPSNFKKQYDENTKYKIAAFNNKEFTMEELGNLLISIYTDLVNNGVEKEDARGYLPGNTESAKVYVTFTIKSLFKFLELRTDSHAQAEINQYANNILDSLTIEKGITSDDLKTFKPYYLNKQDDKLYDGIDEVLK